MRASSFVNETRLWRRHMAMAAIGGFGGNEVNRQAFSEEDSKARALMQSWAESLQLSTFCDPIGNLFFRYQPAGAKGDPVLAGSHADSQPAGGRFDGIYGVLAAFEAIAAIQQSGVSLKRPLEAVAWSNEEGSRFAPGAMGSMVFTGARQVEEFLDTVDAQGIRMADALQLSLAATPQAEPRSVKYSIAAYVEAHVEQGPVLEQAGKDIGVVTDIQGCRWFEVEVLGQARHAGSTPLSVRRDAMQGAHRIVTALNRHFADNSDTTRFTIGRFELQPNSPNTVAARAVLTIDFRHPDERVLRQMGDEVVALAESVVAPCAVKVRESFNNPPVHFPQFMIDAIDQSAQALDLSRMKVRSGAFHDAMFLASVCPTGMIFVPSRAGISHHPDEYTEPQQLAAGARVLCETLVTLANKI